MSEENNQTTKNDLIITEQENGSIMARLKPVEVEDASELFLFKCGCGKAHFRHAGYVSVVMPYIKGDRSTSVANDPVQVMICVSCKKAYAWIDSQMYDVSKLVDVAAWEKTEITAHKMTGPGGQC